MLLMYHHVCPQEMIPAPDDRTGLEGWDYNLIPKHFRGQLRLLLQRGFEFVSLAEYVARCAEGRLTWKVASVTFDDGWLDNYHHACPILSDLGIPATIFVVSGEMAQVPLDRRLSDAQLRELAEQGITIGAHGRTHQNLAELPDQSLREETAGCKDDLEQRLGRAVEYLAYPGGRFSHRVVAAIQEAGFKAACSSIGGGLNGRQNLFWLYRDVFSAQMNCLRDGIFLNGLARRLLNKRARGKAGAVLRTR